jgi:carbamoyltransferase
LPRETFSAGFRGGSNGARALGNRSIVCDPRNASMKEHLNSRIKHREGFRPFAPSVLEERAGGGLKCRISVRSHDMSGETRTTGAGAGDHACRRDGAPADREQGLNPIFWGLINAFEKRPACRWC